MQLTAIMAFMGAHAVTSVAPEGSQCNNCINEDKLESPIAELSETELRVIQSLGLPEHLCELMESIVVQPSKACPDSVLEGCYFDMIRALYRRVLSLEARRQ
jgi:hypothetical protein